MAPKSSNIVISKYLPDSRSIIYKLNSTSNRIKMIDRFSGKWPDFFVNYMLKNRPCIFDRQLTNDWNCRKQWVTCEQLADRDELQRLFGLFKSLISSRLI
jgi:hypothetical protein